MFLCNSPLLLSYVPLYSQIWCIACMYSEALELGGNLPNQFLEKKPNKKKDFLERKKRISSDYMDQ